MSTLNFPNHVPNHVLAWRIFRYLALRLVRGVLKLGWWLLGRSILFVIGFLRLVASPASSGRSQDEFQDLVSPDSPDGQVPKAGGSDGFWRMYLQAYSPRQWRMRRLFPMSTRKNPRDDERDC